MISVLCPSRERVAQLRTSVDSLVRNAAGKIEILVVADDDDQPTIDAAAHAKLGPATRLLITGRKGYDGLHRYYQLAAAAAWGDWLMVWNDDAIMMTPEWDTIIGALPPQVLVANVSSTQAPLCCFPAVRSEACKALGKFSTANPHVDTFWGDVGRLTGTMENVPVFASHDSPVKWGANHDYYGDEHQAQLAEAAGLIRSMMARDGS
jgi:hypothetical protein